MRVQLIGPGSGYMPGGYRRWSADEVVTVDDADTEAVNWYRQHCAGGGGLILEDIKPAKPAIAEESGIAALRDQAEQLGVKVDGRWSASRLEQEITNASKAKTSKSDDN